LYISDKTNIDNILFSDIKININKRYFVNLSDKNMVR
jgi:hypothetical protein